MRSTLLVVALLCALLAGGVLSLSTGGRTDVGLWQMLSQDHLKAPIFADIRAPRTLVAAFLGINLGVAGLVLQAVTRNPLASPSILGINQGAALGLALSLIVPGLAGLTQGVMAVAGAIGAGAITFAIAGGFTGRTEPMRLILGGMAVGAFAFAAVRFTYTLDDDIARTIVRWTVGDITDIRWPAVHRLAWVGVPGVMAAFAMSHRLNMMAMGQDQAQGLGTDPRITLSLGAVLAATLAGVSVTVAGPIAFTGLVVPHLARFVFGEDYRILVPTTALVGAGLMMVADGLSKILTAPIEAPIGVVAALIGAPWFLWQTLRSEAFS